MTQKARRLRVEASMSTSLNGKLRMYAKKPPNQILLANDYTSITHDAIWTIHPRTRTSLPLECTKAPASHNKGIKWTIENCTADLCLRISPVNLSHDCDLHPKTTIRQKKEQDSVLAWASSNLVGMCSY